MVQDDRWHSVAVVFDGDEDVVCVGDGNAGHLMHLYADFTNVADAETAARWVKVDGDGTVRIEVGE